jgi:CRISPR/Cas system-associated exonuclease Cas4 (RecB family)
MVKQPIDVEQLWNSHIENKNELNRKERYEGNEHWFHGSAAGKCVRKIYYESVLKIKPTNKNSNKGNRILRVGTVLHDEFQDAVLKGFNNIYNNIYNIYIEKEHLIQNLNVRGFSDLIIEKDGVFLYDFKTIGGFPYKIRFEFMPKYTQNDLNEMQLATYGLSVKEEFGRLDGMYLTFLNKDTMDMRTIEVNKSYLDKAKKYWENVNKIVEKGLPPLDYVNSPAYKWECKWKNGCCPFYERCVKDG